MNYISIDLETTGVDLLKDSPIQIAWEVYDEDRKFLTNSSVYIKTFKLSPVITEITGITQETLDLQGVTTSAAANIYNSLMWKFFPVVLIGYNILNFDFPMLQNWLTRTVPGRFKYPPLMGIQDVMFTYCDHFKQKNWPKLAEAGRRLKIDFDPKALHDAETDVNLTWKIYDKICPM